MPAFDIKLESEPSESYRTQKVRGQYDFRDTTISENIRGEIELPSGWQIGAIVGSSGTGKSHIAQDLWPHTYIMPSDLEFSESSVIDDFDETIGDETIFKTLHRVGFSSIPDWLKPYSVLSCGEKMRVQVARALLECDNPIVFDEFTSVVDREVAQISSAAIQKGVKELGKQFVAVSCHRDILPWLEPDWVFDTDIMQSQKKTSSDQSWSLMSKLATEACGECFANITI